MTDTASFQEWFAKLSRQEQVTALLAVMHGFTIAMRTAQVEHHNHCEGRWRLALRLSEINHRLTSAAYQLMTGQPTFPTNVLIEMILDHPDDSELAGHCRAALERAIRLVPNKDAPLPSS
jgi:hypothetical protein